MPDVHVVDRYFKTVETLGVTNDMLVCDFYLRENEKVDVQQAFGVEQYLAFAIGAQYATKRLPVEKMIELLQEIRFPVVFLGDKNDALVAEQLIQHFPDRPFFQACGKYSLRQSASLVQQAKAILTHDTGLMHIAACFKTPIVSVWGNTVPALGMYPYLPGNRELYSIHEVQGLSCRPCSKIGFKSCPKKHFNCMNLQDCKGIVENVNQFMK